MCDYKPLANYFTLFHPLLSSLSIAPNIIRASLSTLQNYNKICIYTQDFYDFSCKSAKFLVLLHPNYVICPKGQKLKKH